MDADRQIRFLYPPVFFFASLIVGIMTSASNASLLGVICPGKLDGGDMFGIAAGGSLMLIASGFAIGTISHLLMRIIAWFRGTHFEACLSAEDLDAVWSRIGATGTPDQSKALFAVATLDHELLPRSLHAWVTRRWHAFTIGANSAVALVLSLIAVPLLVGGIHCLWLFMVPLLATLLSVGAYFAWRDALKMIAFQARMPRRERPALET